jgi:hypothetical protein
MAHNRSFTPSYPFVMVCEYGGQRRTANHANPLRNLRFQGTGHFFPFVYSYINSLSYTPHTWRIYPFVLAIYWVGVFPLSGLHRGGTSEPLRSAPTRGRTMRRFLVHGLR